MTNWIVTKFSIRLGWYLLIICRWTAYCYQNLHSKLAACQFNMTTSSKMGNWFMGDNLNAKLFRGRLTRNYSMIQKQIFLCRLVWVSIGKKMWGGVINQQINPSYMSYMTLAHRTSMEMHKYKSTNYVWGRYITEKISI